MEDLNSFKISGTSNSVTGVSRQIEHICTHFKPFLLITFVIIFVAFSFRYIFDPRKLICKCKLHCVFTLTANANVKTRPIKCNKNDCVYCPSFSVSASAPSVTLQ
jgi:hypothetical protein